MNEEYYEIDTKGICLLCFRECSEEELVNPEKASLATSFKMMLRYLKIDIKNLCKFPSYFLQSMDALVDIDAVITTCVDCSNVQKKFGQLFQEFERIRLQLDKCVQSLHHRMTVGSMNQQQIREYEKRMSTRNPAKLFDAYVAERLRKEVLQNCELKIDASVPKVVVAQTDNGKTGHSSITSRLLQQLQRPRPKSLHHPKAASSTFSKASPAFEPAIIVSTQTAVMKDSNVLLNDTTSTWNHTEKSLETEPEVETQILVEAENVIVKVEPSLMTASVDPSNMDNNPSVITSSQPTPKSAQSNLVSYVESSEIIDMNKSSSSSHTCAECGKSFSTAPGLWGHMQVHTVNSNKTGTDLVRSDQGKKKIRKCETCGKMVLNLSRHMKSHLTEKEITCNHCGRGFTTYHNYRLHFVTMHTMEALSKYLPAGTTEENVQDVVSAILDTAKPVFSTDGRPGNALECPYCSRKADKRYNLKPHVLHSHFDKVLMHFQRLHEVQSRRMSVSADGHDFTVTVGMMDDDGESAIIDPQSLLTNSSASYALEMDQDDQEEQPQALFDPLG
ncbi:Chorion transcription factor Cf2 [Orchesella cincta]|uniref:Chorion transcription factor Cf2 n=1 Tax=Orchesella cincta TaxID=48709 RepID=A0A1D2NGZ3_ORCCI|nr:Chorion transcription factor Cf2 [Orchesella cincta]